MLQATWTILCQLSPWLLIGMLISGILHVALPQNFIRRRFNGFWGVVKAVAIGVPLPLCSCGVIPAGIGLKNDGADDGASVGFLISTPQTGVDSVLVSLAFFGWPFAVFKMVAALVLGLLGGWISNLYGSSMGDADITENANTNSNNILELLKFAIAHSFEVFRSFWIWLLVGVIVSAAIQVWVPSAWFNYVEAWGPLSAMLIVLLISTPMYICATASVPLAAALVAEGFPTSAALVFLMAGPATNATTIGAIYGRFGLRIVFTYLSVVIAGSFVSGLLMDWVLVAEFQSVEAAHHHIGSLANVSAITVIGLSAWCFVLSIKKWVGKSESEFQLPLTGLHCDGCAKKVEKALKNKFDNRIVSVTYHPQAINLNCCPDDGFLCEIRSEIEQLGYEISSSENG